MKKDTTKHITKEMHDQLANILTDPDKLREFAQRFSQPLAISSRLSIREVNNMELNKTHTCGECFHHSLNTCNGMPMFAYSKILPGNAACDRFDHLTPERLRARAAMYHRLGERYWFDGEDVGDMARADGLFIVANMLSEQADKLEGNKT